MVRTVGGGATEHRPNHFQCSQTVDVSIARVLLSSSSCVLACSSGIFSNVPCSVEPRPTKYNSRHGFNSTCFRSAVQPCCSLDAAVEIDVDQPAVSKDILPGNSPWLEQQHHDRNNDDATTTTRQRQRRRTTARRRRKAGEFSTTSTSDSTKY